MNEDRSSDHLVLGGLLFLVFSLVVALVFVYTRAGDVSGAGASQAPVTSANIANVAPVVESVNIALSDNGAHIGTSTGITLAVGGQTQVVVWGTISDENGVADISNVNTALYRSGVSGANACTADKNDCYKLSSCTITPTTATQSHYLCTLSPMEYFADATITGGQYPSDHWVAYTAVTDLSTTSASMTNTTEVNTLLALNIPAAIAYGSFALGASTTAGTGNTNDRHAMPLIQRGNVVADVEVYGSGAGNGVMACSVTGSIPVANQRWSLFDVGYSNTASSTALTGTLASAADTNIAVGYQGNGHDNGLADGAAITKNLYWNILIPSTGVNGSCTGQNTITVRAS